MPRKKSTSTKKTSKKEKEPAFEPKPVGTFIKYAEDELEKIKQKRRGNVQLDDRAEQFAAELDKFLETSTGTSVKTLSERDDIPFWINTNSMSLNWIISNDFNNGIPGTKAILISGKSGKGKSLILDNILGENIRNGGISYKLDIEDAGTEDFTAKIVGSEEIASRIRIISAKDLTSKTAIKDQVITIEKLTKITNKLIDYQASKGSNKQKSIVIGVDSITQLTSEKEYEKVVKSKEAKDMTSPQKMRELFRTLTQKFKSTNITMVGLAQLTANIGVMFGSKETENAKGTGYLYASSLSLQMVSDKPLTMSINGGEDVPIGIRMKIRTTKNRVEFKGREAWLYFYFNSGIDKYGGLLELLTQFGIIKASAKPSLAGEYADSSTFQWVHPDTGKKYVFMIPIFSTALNAMEPEEREMILKIWNLQLNLKWENITQDLDEAELLSYESPVDEDIDTLIDTDDSDNEDNEYEDDEGDGE